MFRYNYHYQGAYYLILLKLLLLKQSESSVKIHRCGQFGDVAAYISGPGWCMCVTLFGIRLTCIPNSVTDSVTNQ
jgi:hypothetical protein